MILQEFKRCWKSKINLAIPIVMAFFVVATISSNLYDRNEQLEIIEEGISMGFDVSDSLPLYEGMSGTLYHFERLFFLHTPAIFFMMIVFLIGVGINVAGNMFSALKTGYGINIVTRMPYSSYLRKKVIAQFLYAFTFLLAFFLMAFIGLLLFEGDPFIISPLSGIAPNGEMGILSYLFVLISIVLYITICQALLILIASLSYVFLKNIYAIQFVPIAFFVGAYIFAFTFENLNAWLNLLARAFIFEHALFSLTGVFEWSRDGSFAFAMFYPLLLLTIFIILYKLNVTKFREDYL